MASPTDVKLRIIAENLARAALQEAKRDVEGLGAAGTKAATGTTSAFGKMVFEQGRVLFATQETRQGVSMFEHALRTLSFQAAGIPGPIGKAASAIGILGIGTGPVLIATAALGVFGLAFKHASDEAELAAHNVESAGERMRKVFAAALNKDVEEAGARLELFRRRLTEAKDALAGLRAAPVAADRDAFGLPTQPVGAGAVPTNAETRADEIAAAANRVTAAQQLVNDAEKAAQEAAQKATDALERQANVLAATVGIRQHAVAIGQDENTTLLLVAEATTRAAAAAAGYDATHTAALITQAKRIERLRQENQVLEAQRDLLEELAQISADVSAFFAQPFQREIIAGIKVPGLNDILAQEGQRQASLQTAALEKQGGEFAFGLDQSFFDNVQHGVDQALSTTPGFKSGGLIMAQAFVTAVGQFAQGGAANVFGGFGSILTGASQVKQFAGASFLGPAGFALSAVGSVISVFDHSAERRHKEMMAQLKRIEEKAVPEPTRVQPIFIGASPANAGDVAYAVARLQDRDAISRGVGGMP